MDFREIIEIIKEAIRLEKDLEIYYPQTENSPEGWREVRVENITNDIPPQGEVLVPEKDHLSPGHIVNAYNLSSEEDKDLKSFIIGKIKHARFVKHN